MHDQALGDAAWTAGLRALAGHRPVVVVTDLDAGPPAAAAPGSLVVLAAALGRVGADGRNAVVEALAGADLVLICPPPGDGVRVQPPQCLPDWVADLAAHGLFRVPAALAWLHSWGVVLERAPVSIADLVGRYERLVLPAAGHRPPAADTARVLALTDRVIGLEAELAETAYRRDQALLEREAAVVAEQAAVAAEQVAVAAERAATASLDAVLASASWRIGQHVVGPLRRAAATLMPRRRGKAGR